jgi:hypothetical protein
MLPGVNYPERRVACSCLDGTVLVADAGVVARGAQAVVFAQGVVPLGQLFALGQVVERCRQAVGTVLFGHTTSHPQRILHAVSQRLEALAAEHHADVAPAAVGQGELVQPVRERQATQADVELVGHREVRQSQTAGRVRLGEVDLALAAVLGAPLANPALQGCRVRRTESPNRSGWRRCSSSSSVTAISEGAPSSIGTTSASQTAASGSARVRQWRGGRCDGSTVAASSRTIFRRMQREANPFPPPRMQHAGSANLWDAADVAAWERRERERTRSRTVVGCVSLRSAS